MNLFKLIIHRIDKKRNKKSELLLSDTKQGLTDPVRILFEEIRELYRNKSSKGWGDFYPDSEENPFTFKKLLEDYLKNEKYKTTASVRDEDDEHGDSDPDGIIDLSKRAMGILKKKMDIENFATGGYVLFFHYENNDGLQFFMVVMLNKVKGVSVKDGQNLILESIHLDLDNLHLAARINISKWGSDKPEKYLSFVKGRGGGDVAVYFREFIGCDDSKYSDSRTQSTGLVKVLNQYCKKKEYEAARTQAIRDDVFALCQRCNDEGRPVHLKEVSQVVDWDKPDDFFKWANSEEVGLPAEIDPHMGALKRLKKVYYRGKDFTITINRDALNSRIIYNKTMNSLTIYEIPDKLKNDLMEQ